MFSREERSEKNRVVSVIASALGLSAGLAKAQPRVFGPSKP